MKRIFMGSAIVLGCIVAGFFAGGLLTAQLAPGEGMAAGAGAAVGALIGALCGLICGIFLATRMPERKLAIASVIAIALVVSSYSIVAWQASARRNFIPTHVNAPPQDLDPAGNPIPPALPAPNAPDTLIGLVSMATAPLPRFETRESDYEVKAITVYRREGSWYLAGLADGGREWLHTRNTGPFLPLEELLVGGLNYLTREWDGMIRDTTNAGAPVRRVELSAAGNAEVPANVTEVRREDGTVFLRVEILDRSPCDGGDLPKVVTTGWIAAWSPAGKPAAWFYSRGC